MRSLPPLRAPLFPTAVAFSLVILFVTALSVLLSFSTALHKTSASPSALPDDLRTIYDRRIDSIVELYQYQTYPLPSDETFSQWLSAFQDGKFADVDYTAGCDARRANWPARSHWNHLNALATAYKGFLPSLSSPQFSPDIYAGNETVKGILDSAMDWWFNNDFTEDTCVDQGGMTNSSCPCGTPGFWTSNWYSNIILIPRLTLYGCLLLNDEITPKQRQSCIHMGERGYATFDRYVFGLGYMTGANTLDVANNGVSVGLLRYLGGLDDAEAIVEDAYRRAHDELTIHPEDKADGIRPDGSFGQHGGILYDGNYGKDYTNLAMDLETQASGTQWAANSTSQDALALHVDGMQWMVYFNTLTNVSHWDFSVLGRILIYPVVDNQATSELKVNVSQISDLGQQWESKTVESIATDLSKNVPSANAGGLVGNRMFYNNDYMVHRGANFVTTVKMLSNRTSNTECVNSANPYGFHLGQGAVFNYISGNEYEDVMASWDWNLIPGITTDYAATPLTCQTTQWSANETFVGGASSKSHQGLGVVATKYTNPQTGSLKYRKAWFFFQDGIQHVTVSGIESKTQADVYSVLDQKRRSGDVYVDGQPISIQGEGITNFTTAKTLWHAGIGYTFDDPQSPGVGSGQQQLSISHGNRTGNWSLIGTSTADETTVDLLAAWVQHDSRNLTAPLSYSVYPGTDSYATFAEKTARRVKTVRNDNVAAAVVDQENKVAIVVFWEQGVGGDVPILLSDLGLDASSWGSSSDTSAIANTLRISSDEALTLILDFSEWNATVADPTHLLANATLTFSLENSDLGESNTTGSVNASVSDSRILTVPFPQGLELGKSIALSLRDTWGYEI